MTGVIITQLFLTHPSSFPELNWLAGALACATAAVLMAITKTIHPPAGATAVFAASQPNIAALGWYYVPVVMLWVILAIVVGLIINNIQRRYPVFWVTANELPRQPKEAVVPEPGHSSHESPTVETQLTPMTLFLWRVNWARKGLL